MFSISRNKNYNILHLYVMKIVITIFFLRLQNLKLILKIV